MYGGTVTLNITPADTDAHLAAQAFMADLFDELRDLERAIKLCPDSPVLREMLDATKKRVVAEIDEVCDFLVTGEMPDF